MPETVEPVTLAEARAELDRLPDGVHFDAPTRHWRVAAGADRWGVQIAPGMIRSGNPGLARLARRQFVVADETVWRAKAGELIDYYTFQGTDFDVCTIPAGEDAKSLAVVDRIAAAASKFKLDPESPFVAFGGGATGDVTRFTASTFRKGTPVVCLPTTPLGAIDADIGLKCFLNVLVGNVTAKNLLCAFWPADMTFIDPELFLGVSYRDMRSAAAEALKMGIIGDAHLVGVLEAHGVELEAESWQGEQGLYVMTRAIDGMLRALQSNPREKEKRRGVDFGHFIGKLIERRAEPPLPHGYSVAICMAVTMVAAAERKLLDWGSCERMLGLTRSLGLPLSDPLLTPQTFTDSIAEAITARGGQQNVPVPRTIGGPVTWVQDFTVPELVEAAAYLEDWSHQ